MERACHGGSNRSATGEWVDVTGEQAAWELAELDADVAAALAAIGGNEPMDPRPLSPALRVRGHEKSPPPVLTGGGPWWSLRESTRKSGRTSTASPA